MENLNLLKKYLDKYIRQNNYTNIVAIYGMGSSVRRETFNDYDMVVFIKNDNFAEIRRLEDMKNYLQEKTGKIIDYNIMGMECIKDNLLNTDLFIHRYRHGMILYELVTVKNLIYGEDILKDYIINYYDLIHETMNLALTQVYRLNKEFLYKNRETSFKNARKYLKYSIEFAMIFAGMENPYMNLKVEDVIEKYPSLEKYKEAIDSAINCVTCDIDDAYDCMVEISCEMYKRYKYLISYITKEQNLKLTDELTKKYFKFKSIEELEEFKRRYLSQDDYKKISLEG